MTDAQRSASAEPDAQMYREWLDRSRRGDVAAFESLYRYLYTPLREFAEGYLRSRELAEEIVQDVFLAIWEGREQLEVRGSVRGYLYVAVRNRALNLIRRGQAERRSTDRIALEEGARVARNTAHEQLVYDELAASVQRVIDELPPRMRQAYTLYYQHDLSYAEVAAVMGNSVKTVENQLARALKIIWQRMEGDTRHA